MWGYRAVESKIMQLGFMSAIVPDLTLYEVFALGKATGYRCVELMCWPPGKADRRYAGVTHIDVSNFDGGDASRVLSLAESSGMEISQDVLSMLNTKYRQTAPASAPGAAPTAPPGM